MCCLVTSWDYKYGGLPLYFFVCMQVSQPDAKLNFLKQAMKRSNEDDRVTKCKTN